MGLERKGFFMPFVREQSGGTPTIILMGTFTGSQTAVTVDCTSLDNYQQLTADDFIVVLKSVYGFYNSTRRDTIGPTNTTLSYNASTGILTVYGKCVSAPDWTSGAYSISVYYLNGVILSS